MNDLQAQPETAVVSKVETVSRKIMTVCAHCYPGQSFLTTFPEVAAEGFELSHGICPFHAEQWIIQVSELTGSIGGKK